MIKQPLTREDIAKRVAQDLTDGEIVNLGIGIPNLISNYISSNKEVIFHSENGLLGMGSLVHKDDCDPELINASKEYVKVVTGASYFHHADSFSMLRGKHIDVAVIGGMQVSKNGDLANWKIKGRKLGSIGGAMDIALGAKKVYVAMTHVNKKNEGKIVENLSFPLTARSCVDRIYTDLAVIEVIENGLRLLEIAPEYTIEDIQNLTEPDLEVSDSLKEISL